jgi:hypothetical protein
MRRSNAGDKMPLFKKRRELEMMLSYFNGKVTGNEVISFLNEEVRAALELGNSERQVPCTYREGLRIYKKGHKRGGLSPLQALSEKEKEEIRRRYVDGGETIYQLAPVYGVSPSTIFKAIRGLRRGPVTVG